MQPFRFATRVDDTDPLIKRGTLNSCIKRLNKKLKQSPDKLKDWDKIKVIRDEFVKLREQL